jgi:hypothetical protein
MTVEPADRVSMPDSSPASAGGRFNMNFRLDPLRGAQDAALGFLGDRPKQLRPFAVRFLQRQPPISESSRVTHCRLRERYETAIQARNTGLVPGETVGWAKPTGRANARPMACPPFGAKAFDAKDGGHGAKSAFVHPTEESAFAHPTAKGQRLSSSCLTCFTRSSGSGCSASQRNATAICRNSFRACPAGSFRACLRTSAALSRKSIVSQPATPPP